jgi:hypothetical protein
MLPTGTDNLLQFSARILTGIDSHGRWIGLGTHSADDLRLKIGRLEQSQAAVDISRNTKILATNRLGLADKVLKTWLEKSRLVVMLACGPRWSESWVATGFTDRRTRVRRSMDDRISLARKLVSFFARRPEFGVNFAEVTAARGRAIYERVLQSCQMLQLAKNDFVLTKGQRAAAENDLRNGLRRLISSLKVQLDGSDARWADFGLVPAHSRKRRARRSLLKRKRTTPIPFVSPAHRPADRVAAA